MRASSRSDGQSDVVLVTWLNYDQEAPHAGGPLKDRGYRFRVAPRRAERTAAQVAALCEDAVAAIVSTDPFDESVLEAAPKLRVIARVGVGHDSIDLTAATAAGVVVTVTPGGNERIVAEHTLALMMAAVRRILPNDAAIRRGRWDRAGGLTPWELSGKVVGLVGYGAIGRHVAALLSGFAVELIVCDPAHSGANGQRNVSLDELLDRADVISLHTPLDASTRGLIGKRELDLMGPGAILVNTARGPVVDEASLVEALRTGRLRAAALDVFETEPPRRAELLALPNVVLSPHIAGLNADSIDAMTQQATACVVAVLEGRRPPGVVNPAVFEHPRASDLVASS